jgi:hypothetical protein
VLEAYFDESERENGLLCVAGYVFVARQADRLAKEFEQIFSPYGGFHMKDLVHKKKGFKEISDAERTRLLKEAVRIVKARFSYGVAVTVDIREYDAFAPRWIRGFRNAYPFLCHLAMTGAASLVRKHGDPGPIKYVFEAGHPHEAEARHSVRQMSRSAELREHYLYASDDFLSKADAVPLQAADLLAWESAKFKHETVDGEREIRKSLLALVAAAPARYHLSFCGGETLQRALRTYRDLALEQLAENQESKRQRGVKRNIGTSHT